MINSLEQIGTHDGAFHADECMAVAILRRNNPNLKVVRTRDSVILKQQNARIDIGFKYNPDNQDYDHHQKEGAGKRENGVPYASAGLIWKHFGKDCVQNEVAWEYVDKKLIQPIDAGDNGNIPKRDIPYLSLGDIIKAYNNKEDNFESAVKLSYDLLDLIIVEGDMFLSHVKTIKEAEELYDGEIIIINKDLDTLSTWQYYIVPKTKTKYIINPSKNGLWKARAVPTEIEGFESRTPFPQNWRGKDKDNLASVTGIEGSEFCHKTGFLAVARDRLGAIELAKKSLLERLKEK